MQDHTETNASYEAPRLVVLGTLHELTLGSGLGLTDTLGGVGGNETNLSL